GNMVTGIPIGADMEYQGGFWNLLGPYPLLVGVTTLSLFMLHGTIYLYLKTEGALQEKVRGWFFPAFGVFGVLYFVTTVATLVGYPRMIENFRDFSFAWIVALLTLLAI